MSKEGGIVVFCVPCFLVFISVRLGMLAFAAEGKQARPFSVAMGEPVSPALAVHKPSLQNRKHLKRTPTALSIKALSASVQSPLRSKTPQEALKDFLSNASNDVSLGFVNEAILAYASSQSSISQQQRQYVLSNAIEAMFVIEAYRTLCDRGPMPAHRVLNELEESFGFVLYDHKVFVWILNSWCRKRSESVLGDCW